MRRVAIFARRPVVGRVKTRLSPALPPEMACILYRGMLADAVAAASGSALADERFVYWAEEGSVGDAGGLIERVQQGGDLGERLIAAFEELIVEPGDHAVVIGADCPMLEAEVVDEAFRRMATSPNMAVVAPASDGGYALIGLSRKLPSLFRNVPWGANSVLDVTRALARKQGEDLSILNEQDDVDRPEDLCRLAASIASMPASDGGSVVCGHTVESLVRIGLISES